MDRINYNSDITIRVLSLEDLYDGMIVQSVGNSTCIYTIIKKENKWYYKSIYQIIGRNSFDGVLDRDVYEVESGLYQLELNYTWCETEYTKRYDKSSIRDSKIDNILE
jgi:hypothetical protein